ncbi:MAG: hypothetical protein Unbinned6046contig1000_2 [Prokaryotic dsDNA virus sp.]|nr:MAG: hypothetical protein Unbinned6046contig1000_2 [Prokaryotic dsDNA virus sp.]|tara:strand:+ start:543 stop:788 length:246 start_codon:yes stop_codon:yes gene_type:complete
MLHSKFSLHIDVENAEVSLYANTEFGFSIHSFDVEITNGHIRLSIPDPKKFKLLAQVLQTSQKNLMEYITNEFKNEYSWQN